MTLNLFEVIGFQKRATLVVTLMSEIKPQKQIKDSIGIQSEALPLNKKLKPRFVLQMIPVHTNNSF